MDNYERATFWAPQNYPEEWNARNPDGTYNALYLTSMEYTPRVYSFASEEKFYEWDGGVREVKNLAASINDKWEDLCPEKLRAWQKWLENYKEFATRWGESHVPPDILAAKDDVHQGLLVNGY